MTRRIYLRPSPEFALAWFAMVMWPFWIVPASLFRPETSRRAGLPEHLQADRSNVIRLEAYRQRSLPVVSGPAARRDH